jgi:HEAT repeat protein
LEVLAALGSDAAVTVPKLIEIMSEDELLGGLQERAVATLSKIGPKAAPAVLKLIEMAERDTANARGWCIQAFSSIGPAAAPAVPFLIDLLMGRVRIDPDPFYVPMAAHALGNIGAIEALPALLQVLRKTDDADVAHEVVEAIGKARHRCSRSRGIIDRLGWRPS